MSNKQYTSVTANLDIKDEGRLLLNKNHIGMHTIIPDGIDAPIGRDQIREWVEQTLDGSTTQSWHYNRGAVLMYLDVDETFLRSQGRRYKDQTIKQREEMWLALPNSFRWKMRTILMTGKVAFLTAADKEGVAMIEYDMCKYLGPF